MRGTSPINSDSIVHLAPHPGSHQLSSKFFYNFLGGLLMAGSSLDALVYKGCHSILIQYTMGVGEPRHAKS